MKIIELINSLGNGGAEKFVVELSNALSADNTVMLCVFRPIEDWMVFPKMLEKNVTLLSLQKTTGASPTIYLKLFSLFKREKPDVVHFHLDASIKYILPLTVLFPSVKFVHTIHSSHNSDKISRFKRLKKIRFLAKRITYVCIAKPILDDFKKGFPAFNYVLIPNGIKQMQPSPSAGAVAAEIASYKKNDRTKVFTIIGNYSAPKNFSLITKVFAKLQDAGKDVILVIIGNDSSVDQSEWEKIAAQKCENTFMLGLKNNVQDYLACSDAYCLCSFYEGLPISILEAYSLGKPVISTPAGGVPGILQHKKNGLLTDGFTESDYMKSVTYFLEMPEAEINAIKANNLKDFVDHYTIKKTSDSYLKYFKE